MIRIFLATKVPKGEDKKKAREVSCDIIDTISSMNDVEILMGAERDLDESDFLLVFGHDCRHIKNSDLVVVDAREKIGAGTAQEMLIAKYFSKPVITILPKGSHHRRSDFIINGKKVDDWIHPFLFSTSDAILEDCKDLPKTISDFVNGKIKAKSIDVVDKAIEHLEKRNR